MATCTITVDCGLIGEQDLTISYKYYKGFKGNAFEPEEHESASIYWIKIGGSEGVEVDLPDDFVVDELIPHCVEHYNGEADGAAEEHADRLREERRAA
jgi:hypothetical protein